MTAEEKRKVIEILTRFLDRVVASEVVFVHSRAETAAKVVNLIGQVSEL
jgi:hypothetical protein